MGTTQKTEAPTATEEFQDGAARLCVAKPQHSSATTILPERSTLSFSLSLSLSLSARQTPHRPRRDDDAAAGNLGAAMTAASDARDDAFPARTQTASGAVGGVATTATSVGFADKVLVTLSQDGRLSQWVSKGGGGGEIEMSTHHPQQRKKPRRRDGMELTMARRRCRSHCRRRPRSPSRTSSLSRARPPRAEAAAATAAAACCRPAT